MVTRKQFLALPTVYKVVKPRRDDIDFLLRCARQIDLARKLQRMGLESKVPVELLWPATQS